MGAGGDQYGDRLTLKQEKACIAYVSLGDRSKAYRAAYDVRKMTPEAVNAKASWFFDQVKIRKRVDELMAPIMAKMEVDGKKTLKRLMQGQEFDVRRLYHPLDHPDSEKAGKLKHPTELDDDTAKAIVGVKFDKDTGVLVEYKVIDVKGCAELIGRNQNLWKDVGSKENPLTFVPVQVVFGDDD